MESMNEIKVSEANTNATYTRRRSRRSSTIAPPEASQSTAPAVPPPPHRPTRDPSVSATNEDFHHGLELRSKRRHQIFSSRPFHPDFFDRDSKRRFDKYFASKECLIEKSVVIDVAEVVEILKNNGLESCVSFTGTFNKTLVAEFYANISDSILDEGSPLHNKVFVRGNWVEFSPSTISSALGCPDIESFYTPELERPHISPTFIVRTLTNRLVTVWPANNALVAASSLCSTYAVLLKLCKFQWIPSTHLSGFNLREAMLLYLLVSNPPSLSLGSVILENIVERSIPHQQKKLIHPVLISRLLEQQSIPFRETDIIVTIPEKGGSSKRSARINDATGTSLTPAFRERILHALTDCQKDVQRLQYRIDSLVLQLTEDDGGEEEED